jgi:acetyltransferase-like isoleucine patch superfamily enzyme
MTDSSLKRWLLAMHARLLLVGRSVVYGVRYGRARIDVHPSSRVSRLSILRTDGGGSIRIGRNCVVHDYAMILSYGGDIEIGDDCSVNPFSILYGHGGLRVGNDVRIAAHSVLIPANHPAPRAGHALSGAGVTARGIDIADHVWLGAGVRILDGVQIGPYVTVAAGAVVTRSVAAHATVAGVPARDMGKRHDAEMSS